MKYCLLKVITKGVIMNKKNGFIFILCIALPLAYYTFKTEIEVENCETEYKLVNEVFVEKKDNQIILEGFKDPIRDIKITDNQISFISIHKKYGEKKYFYDFRNNELFYSNIALDKEIIESKVKSRDYEKILSELDIKELDDELLYKISDSNDKLICIDSENNLISYNLKNDKMKIIKSNNNIKTSIDFFNNYTISEKGGYISINYGENNLSILGADTGNLYGSEIQGYDATWISDTKLLLNHYDMKNEEVKLGIYNVLNRKIKYFYSTNNDIYKVKYYYDGTINLFEIDSKEKLFLVRYNSENNEFAKIDIGKIKNSKIIDIQLYVDKLIVIQEDVANYKLSIIDLKTNIVRKYENASMFLDNYLQLKDEFIFLKLEDKYLRISDDNIKYLIRTDNKLINMNDDIKKFIIFNFKNENEYYINIIENS